MVLTQADVAELSAWHGKRAPSMIKIFQDRRAESRYLRDVEKLINSIQELRVLVETKHKIAQSAKEIEHFEKILDDYISQLEEIMKTNFKVLASALYQLKYMEEILKKYKDERKEPTGLVDDAVKKIRQRRSILNQDAKVIRLFALKNEEFAA